MFYVLSKLVFFFIAPSNLVWILIAAGLALQAIWRQQRLGFNLILAGLTGLLLFGFSPLAAWLLYPLEQRFAASPGPVRSNIASTGPIDGIIMLGGFEDGRISRRRGVMAVNESAERLIETVRLAKLSPEADVIFTGGAGGILLDFDPAGSMVRDYLVDVGIEEKRILIESASRNTWENAVRVREMFDEPLTGRYLLVTAAWHMPRAVGVFRKAGFEILPWPVDFRTADEADKLRPFGQVWAGLERSDQAIKEYAGLLAYWLTGRTSELFPGPKQSK